MAVESWTSNVAQTHMGSYLGGLYIVNGGGREDGIRALPVRVDRSRNATETTPALDDSQCLKCVYHVRNPCIGSCFQ